jgi:23S rRNA pseudouridine1911/1915/1917 synthase
MGTPVVGDKIYGPDESLFVEHLEHGWTPRLELALESRRHLLSALELRLGEHHWSIAPPLDIRQFVEG